MLLLVTALGRLISNCIIRRTGIQFVKFRPYQALICRHVLLHMRRMVDSGWGTWQITDYHDFQEIEQLSSHVQNIDIKQCPQVDW